MSCRKDVVIIGLQLWIPLNGDIKNYGLCNAELSYSNLSFEDSGKIGKCLSTGGIVMSAETTGKILNNNAITISLWLYVNAPTGSDNRAMIFGNGEMVHNNNRKFSLFQYPTCNDFHYSWMNDSPSTFDAGLVTNVLPSYQWTHIAVTYDNPNICVYINGELKYTSSGVSNSASFHYTTNVVYNSPYHKVNDFRIYDECLAPKQIKYISQAMICHYPMGNVDGKIGGRNLCLYTGNSYTMGFGISNTSWIDGYAYIGLPTTINNSEILPQGNGYWRFLENETYTQTIWLETDATIIDLNECRITWFRENDGHDVQVAKIIKISENSYKIISTYTMLKESQNVRLFDIINLHNALDIGNSGTYLKFGKLKIEKGTESTPWTPAPEDNSQFYDNIIPDISGYQNNATVKDSTSPTWSNDSPRYLGSYKFDATKEMFLNPIVFSGFADSYTFSWWGKNSQPDSSMYWGFIDGNRLNLYSTDGYLFWNIGDSQDNPFNDPVTTNKVSSYTDGKWHHYCITGDGASNKLYVDGKIYGIAKTYRKITGTKIHINGWDDGVNYKINGNISDFRIYATALSESDVLNLYQSSASLDSHGNLMLSGEVIE